MGLCTVGIGGARNAEAGGQRGGKGESTRGNNILCVCGTNVGLYIQLSCTSKRLAGTRAPGWGSGLRGPVASIPAIMESKSGASSPHFWTQASRPPPWAPC